MAAVVLPCQRPGCGTEFVASRKHAKWCSDRRRVAHARRPPNSDPANLAGLPADFEERAWRAADGDGIGALIAALIVLWQLDLEAAA